MKFVIAEKKREGYDLQHQEEQEIEIPSDEEKYITHRWKYFLYRNLPGKDIRLPHYKWIPVVMF